MFLLYTKDASFPPLKTEYITIKRIHSGAECESGIEVERRTNVCLSGNFPLNSAVNTRTSQCCDSSRIDGGHVERRFLFRYVNIGTRQGLSAAALFTSSRNSFR